MEFSSFQKKKGETPNLRHCRQSLIQNWILRTSLIKLFPPLLCALFAVYSSWRRLRVQKWNGKKIHRFSCSVTPKHKRVSFSPLFGMARFRMKLMDFISNLVCFLCCVDVVSTHRRTNTHAAHAKVKDVLGRTFFRFHSCASMRWKIYGDVFSFGGRL